MASVVDDSFGSNALANVNSIAWSHNTRVIEHRFLEVLVVITDPLATGPAVTGITYGVSALTFKQLVYLDTLSEGGGLIRLERWYLVSPGTGPNTITVSLSANGNICGASVGYGNVSSGTPYGAAANSTGNGVSTFSTDVLDTEINGLISDLLGCTKAGSIPSVSFDPPQVEHIDQKIGTADFEIRQGGSHMASPGGTAPVSGSIDGFINVDYAHAAIELKPFVPATQNNSFCLVYGNNL